MHHEYNHYIPPSPTGGGKKPVPPSRVVARGTSRAVYGGSDYANDNVAATYKAIAANSPPPPPPNEGGENGEAGPG